MDSERLHRYAVKSLAASKGVRLLLGLVDNTPDDPVLETEVLGLHFANPVGLAAGFDKHAEAVEGVKDLGFGFTEVGSVTPHPQPGNPQPRLFRLREDQSVINRYGFNSEGVATVQRRLVAFWDGLARSIQEHSNHPSPAKGSAIPAPKTAHMSNQEAARAASRAFVVGVNLGNNKQSESAADDYVLGIEYAGREASYIVINVSSPNTPGLRDLQARQALQELLQRARQARDALPMLHKPPLLVKVAPDLSPAERADVAEACLAAKVDGLVVSNTTVARPEWLVSKHKDESGGLSGAAVRTVSTQMIADMYLRTNGRLPIIGVGGVGSGQDAYDKVRAGASLVQMYSALVFEGPTVVRDIKDELAHLLKADGFTSVKQAVGKDAEKTRASS